MDLLKLVLLLSQFAFFLADLSRRRSKMMKKMAKRAINEVVAMMIAKMELECRRLRWLWWG